MGLKENVIIGKLIPAGTGMELYRGVEIADKENETVEIPDDSDLEDFPKFAVDKAKMFADEDNDVSSDDGAEASEELDLDIDLDSVFDDDEEAVSDEE